MASFWHIFEKSRFCSCQTRERRVILLQSRTRTNFKSLELRRWGQIVSLGPELDSLGPDSMSDSPQESLAFHTDNFEFALISSYLNSKMIAISNQSSQVPLKPTLLDSSEQMLEDWNLENPPSSSVALGQSASAQNAHGTALPPLLERVKSITLNVTQVCNLHCHYCAAGGDGTYGAPQKKINIERTLPQLARALKNITEGQEFHLSFLGGEPLLYPNGMRLICEEVKRVSLEKGFKTRFKVTTNGTILDDQILKLFREFEIEVVVSCDGPDFIQNKRRPGKSGAPSSEKVEKNLRRLQLEEGIRFGLHAVFDSEHTQVLTTLKYFEQFAPAWMEFTYAVDSNDTIASDAYLEELYQSAEYLYNKGGLNALSKIISFKEIFQYLDRKQGIKNHCGIGKSFLVIDAKNDLYPCPWMVENKKNLIEFKPESESNALTDLFSKNLVDLHQCESCWAKNLCGGGCRFVHQQDPAGKSLGFCQRMRGTVMIALRFYGSTYARN